MFEATEQQADSFSLQFHPGKKIQEISRPD